MATVKKKVFKNQSTIDTLASNVLHYRTQRKMTQKELAGECDIDVRQIQRIEYGLTDSKLSVIQSLADALGVSLVTLLTKR